MSPITAWRPGAAVAITPRGPFDLRASMRFLGEFGPAGRPDAAGEPGTLRLAFPVDGCWQPAGVVARQHDGGVVELEADGESAAEACRQAERILSLDFDAAAVAEAVRGDRVARSLVASAAGLRPVLFHSPYEAACWAIIGQRIRMVQAAGIKQRIADRYGAKLTVDGHSISSFPAPKALRLLERPLGLPETKMKQLRILTGAAEQGVLDAGRLRALPAEVALARLRKLPGIGPFSAELILIRGVGHPDVFPRHEKRLHEEMARAYQVDAQDVDQLARIAERWRPYRSWVGFLFRAAAIRAEGR
ncbi:DNA-3-methyladenine glycosylase family protein [Amycolatopsis albispora]|uniref:DNA-3-methyladenine glycosylase II n=1 Tax=Amycolatopsis albispora TaxID=1804986 RepID=A0A344L987_9PSEU|nr:DNA-3-methyladenine glycosylase [Amycolatopsis albispora]AXB44611.1 Fe-S cluster assembly protein HesB [Amycolatopsis albispora]